MSNGHCGPLNLLLWGTGFLKKGHRGPFNMAPGMVILKSGSGCVYVIAWLGVCNWAFRKTTK